MFRAQSITEEHKTGAAFEYQEKNLTHSSITQRFGKNAMEIQLEIVHSLTGHMRPSFSIPVHFKEDPRL